MQTAGLTRLSLGRHFRSIIKQHENDPKRMITTLNDQFKPKANASKLNMLMRLTNVKCNHEEDLDAYFGRIHALAAELEANGLALPDMYLLMVTLNGLSADYDPVHTVIESTDDITLAKAQKMLRNREALLYTHGDRVESVNYVSKQQRHGKGPA